MTYEHFPGLNLRRISESLIVGCIQDIRASAGRPDALIVGPYTLAHAAAAAEWLGQLDLDPAAG